MYGDHERKTAERRFHDQRYEVETRLRQSKYYSIIRASAADFHGAVREAIAGADALEYGCGAEPRALRVGQSAASITGIDLSKVAVDKARRAAAEVLPGARFIVMDAEALGFENDSFDVVYGSAIIHHLDGTRAMEEIVRVLRPRGKAIFVEPLGHNPAINLYRWLTPAARTSDEHPLTAHDLKVIRSFFETSSFRFYHLLSVAAVPFRATRVFDPLLRSLDAADQLLFNLVPASRWLAWYVVMVLSGPKPSHKHEGRLRDLTRAAEG